MSATPVTLFKALPTGLDQWLDTNDPQGIVSRAQCQFLAGYYDADNDDIKDSNESISFFREFMGRDGQVYVLTLTPRDNSGGNSASPLFDVQLRMKGADGTLSTVPASLLAGLNLSPGGLTLTVDALQSLTQSVQTWCSNRVSNPVANITISTTGIGDSRSGTYYCGWTKTQLFRDPATTYTYNYAVQGTRNNTQVGAIGGWGGGQVVKTGGSGHLQGNNVTGNRQNWPGAGNRTPYQGEFGVAHWVTPAEAYERSLAAATEQDNRLARTYADGWDRNTGIYENYAANNGLTIKRMSVVIDGRSIDTMGFQTIQNGLTYTFYWDQAAQCNRIGQVTNATGVNVTNQVLASQGNNTFGKSWNEIRNAVNWVLETRGPAGLSTYSADLFSVESRTGSAEVSTTQETAALNTFLLKWSDYITAARVRNIPAERNRRQEMLDELLQLNPGDLMRLFTGSPGASGSSPAGLQLLNQLIQSASLSMSQVQTLSESLGKIMYLTGRELARNGAQNSPEALAKVSFFKGVQTQVSGLINTLSERVTASGYDQTSLRKVLYHFMLGLQNFTDGTVRASGLTPEATLTYLIQKLVEAGGINTPNFTRNAAIVIGEFGRSVIGTLGILQGLQLVESIPVNEDRGSYFAGLISIVAGSGSQDSTQRLLAQYFGMLASHANQSPEAAKQFTDMQQSAHEDSRKLQDAIVALLMRFLDLLRDSTNRAFSKN